MNITAQIRPPRRRFGEMLAEIVPLVGFIPAYGPPAVFVLGPWLVLVLMLGGPLAWLFALVVVMIVAATVLAALTAAIFAAPYLLVRHLRRHRARHASITAPAAQAVAIQSPRVAA
jgi:cell division protein FtsW (lipid II flippase)